MNWRRVVQLTMVHVGVSITVVPVTSTLNRIMIADMGLSALLVGALIALPYILSPLQVTMGAWSDGHALWGRYRSPWILIGGLMASFGGYLTAHAAYLLPEHFGLGLLACLAVFTLWGMGVNIASVSYLSLLNELSSERGGWRSGAVSVMWTTMILSTIATSIIFGEVLDPFSVDALHTAFGAVWLVASVLVLFGAAGIEPARDQPSLPDDPQHSATSVGEAWQTVRKNRAARRFLRLSAARPRQHPCPGRAAGAVWRGCAGNDRGANVAAHVAVGCRRARDALAGRAADAAHEQTNRGQTGVRPLHQRPFCSLPRRALCRPSISFRGAVILLGLGGGLMTVSNLSLMLDMTVPSAAGLYIGAWGVANFAGQAVGNLASGAMRDALWLLTGSTLAGYGLVFVLEAAGLLVAIWLLRRIFRRRLSARRASPPAGCGDGGELSNQ